MASLINATHPQNGTALTMMVRQNFAYAKSEIEALQTKGGFADYNDTATSGTPITIPATTWTKLTNNILGANTKTNALPRGVTSLWNASTNQLNFTELPLNSQVIVRADLSLTTTVANQIAKARLLMAKGDAIEFPINDSERYYKTAGTHDVIVTLPLYIGSTPVKTAPAEIQFWSDSAATMVVRGWYIRVDKA